MKSPSPVSSSDTWRSLLAYARPHWRALVAGGVLTMLGGFAGLAQPLAAREIVDGLGRDETVLTPILILTGLILIGAIIGSAGAYILDRTAESVVRAARQQLIGRMLFLRMPSMEQMQPGDLISRVTSDTNLLRQATTLGLVQVITESLMIVGIVIMMGFMDTVLLGVTVGVMLIMGVVISFTMPRIRQAVRRAQEAVGTMGSELERVLGAFRTVKAAGAENREAAFLGEAVDRAWSEGVSVAKWRAIAGTTAWLSIQIAFLAVLGIGGARVASGAISVATLVAFLLYLFYLLGPIAQLVSAATQFQSGAAALSRIAEVQQLDAEPETVPRSPDELQLPYAPAPVSVTLQDVAFRYREHLPLVLNGVSFDIPPRGMTALVGPSGAGKTTIFSLIERFYEPERGSILVNERDIRDWPLDNLRAAIGYVEQDAPVLAGTLRDNLRFAAPEATDAEILDVVSVARLSELLGRLPDGLDSAVGHRGTTLSGGERQRVAIARALLRRPRLLLLDEATSQLDAINELAMRETIADLAHYTTVLVVAHRLSTVTMADRIVVLEAGEVRAIGTHEQLIALDDLYRELASTQLLTATLAESR
jgi:ABC-type multidrug transport system fused ATPase/permease subunit